MSIRESLRIYTLEKANKALPLVERIVKDVRQVYREFKEAERKKDVEKHESKKAELVSLLDELNSLGVELKGFEEGLVDFYTRKDGKLVYLCWKLGEKEVSYWHDLHTGFMGRKPVEELKSRRVEE